MNFMIMSHGCIVLNVKMLNCCDTNISVIVNDLRPLIYMHLQLSLT